MAIGDTHAEFQGVLADSQRIVEAVAAWLRASGHTVEVPALRVAPTFDDRRRYQDGGDLWIIEPDDRVRFEVKSTSYTFTGRADWPFTYGAYVTAVGAWERAQPKPVMHIIVSPDLRAIAKISSLTRSEWFVRKSKTRWQEDAEIYCCPLEFVSFEQMS